MLRAYMNELKLEIPEVDAWYGVNDDKKIIEENGANYRTELLGERHLSTPKHFAYLKIAEGCKIDVTKSSIQQKIEKTEKTEKK